jgi:hypothetical protein
MFEMQTFYSYLRKEVETVLYSLSVDDNSTTGMLVSPSKVIHEERRGRVLFALQMIRDERDDAMCDATVDEVVEKILDNAIESYSSSPRDVHEAIRGPDVTEMFINRALIGVKYNTLHDAVVRLRRVDPGTDAMPQCIFTMQVTVEPGSADLFTGYRGFEVQFKSRWIQTKVLRELESLQHVDDATTKEMKALIGSSSFAGFLYDGFVADVPAFGKVPSSNLVTMEAGEDETTFSVHH